MPQLTIQPEMQKATSRRVSDYDPRHVQHCSGCGKPLIAEPVLQCAHCGSELRLRCFAYRAGVDRYIAECIDLDILAEGNTREEAIADLQQALHGYFLTVFDGSITEGLIPRPAPLSHRLRYYLEDALDFFRGLFDRQHKASLVECRYRPEDGRLIHC